MTSIEMGPVLHGHEAVRWSVGGVDHTVTRRHFLNRMCTAAPALTTLSAGPAHSGWPQSDRLKPAASQPVTLFLCGDVMTGRGIDQVLPHPGSPRIYEDYMRSALGYVELAERANGSIPRPVPFSYIWGDALPVLAHKRPDLRIINLETSITTSEDRALKGINYRMHPANTPCITAAKIDCCVLANNHVMDWGPRGLTETLDTLRRAKLKTAGAGIQLAETLEPARMEVRATTRVLVYAFGEPGSGVPRDWAATASKPGVAFIRNLSPDAAGSIAARVRSARRPGDIVVISLHWGPNWGYSIPPGHRAFAHRLIDDGAADIIHGHSSHHPKGIEVYRKRLILYGCGDFLNDYEGIRGYEEFRSELVLMYVATLDPATQELLRLEINPFETRRFRLQHPDHESVRWLRDTMDREGAKLGSRVDLTADRLLELRWR